MILKISNNLKDIEIVQQAFKKFFKNKIQLDFDSANQISIIVDEVLSNIINHSFDDDQKHEIEIQIGSDNQYIYIIFRDNGIPFNPHLSTIRKPESKKRKAKMGGLGIPLLKHFADKIIYERIGNMNQLIVRKRFPQ